MWNNVEGRQEVHYDSETDKTPPTEFAHVAASVGKVLATIKIDPSGRIVARTNNQPQFNPGIGDLTVPFPPADKQPVKPGVSWSIPDELKLPLDDGTIKKVQTQQQYRLEKVEAGVATINVATQVLTPINDPKLQSQLVQRLQSGTIKFDIDAGRLLAQAARHRPGSLWLQRRRKPHAIPGPLHGRADQGHREHGSGINGPNEQTLGAPQRPATSWSNLSVLADRFETAMPATVAASSRW